MAFDFNEDADFEYAAGVPAKPLILSEGL